MGEYPVTVLIITTYGIYELQQKVRFANLYPAWVTILGDFNDLD